MDFSFLTYANIEYDPFRNVDFLHLLRRLWTPAPCDRSVCRVAGVALLANTAKSSYHLNQIIFLCRLHVKNGKEYKTTIIIFGNEELKNQRGEINNVRCCLFVEYIF